MSKGILACNKVYVMNDEVFWLKVEPVRVTNELLEDEEFVRLIKEFVKKKYGFDDVRVENSIVYVDQEFSEVLKIDVYLERYRAAMKSGMDVVDRAMGF